jgi:beta-1,2-mannobiose phosphorylase / 1,2-beta-oligomannan phosphorylase
MAAARAADPDVVCRVAAIDEPNVVRPYGPEVRWRIRQGDPASYRSAAQAINASKIDVVNVQHEFGLYGVWQAGDLTGAYEDHLRGFLKELRKPVVTTLHTVPPEPTPSMRDAVRSIAELSHEVVVMAEVAAELLAERYGVPVRPTIIPHGMPAIAPRGRGRMKVKLGLKDRTIISTFGLVDPRKGLEYMIRGMPDVAYRHPDALYLIAGQTHPELLKTRGEQYRNHLLDTVDRLGLEDYVSFLDQYLEQRDIIDLLVASDVYVTPYLDPQQITSGTLAYALGAGKAIVSTAYLHAVEALAEGRGILVDFRDATALATAVNSILDRPARKETLEHMAYAYARDLAWPRAGERWVELMRRLAAPGAGEARRLAESQYYDLELGIRLPENPLLTSADVKPSLPALEVVSVFNAAAAKVGDETVLLLRVGERPKTLTSRSHDAQTLDLTGPEVRLKPLPPGIPREKLVGLCFLDPDQDPPRLVVAYLPRDLPGLDLSDPRTIRFQGGAGGAAGANDFRDYLTQMSHLRVARSGDGVHFTVDDTPAVVPSDSFEEYGCEDPRATLIDGVWQISYVSAGRLGITTSRLTTTDFRSFEREGVMFLPDQKDVVFFPDRIAGRYVALTRPMPGSFDRVLGIWIAYSDDLVHWGGHRPLAMPRRGMWDELRTGAGSVPFRVPEGWLELYHGVDRNTRYTMGALLLDGADPSRVLGRSASPILVPTQPYERSGLFNDTVFGCGHVPLDDRGERIRLYYGAADTCLAAADFVVREIVDQLISC